MSFTAPELQARIQSLKNSFEEIDCGVQSATISDEDYCGIRLAVISNLFRTMETSLDQISICFEVSKAMFFYQDAIVYNPEFWAEEGGVNQMLRSNNFEMARVDMAELGDRLNFETKLVEAQQGENQDAVLNLLNLVDGYQKLVGRFDECVAALVEMDERKNMNLSSYDEDQKVEINGKTPEAYLKALHMRSSQNAEGALTNNIDLAESYLASIYCMKATGHPLSDIPYTETALRNVLNRFEILEDTRDNRYGFTQIRFG